MLRCPSCGQCFPAVLLPPSFLCSRWKLVSPLRSCYAVFPVAYILTWLLQFLLCSGYAVIPHIHMSSSAACVATVPMSWPAVRVAFVFLLSSLLCSGCVDAGEHVFLICSCCPACIAPVLLLCSDGPACYMQHMQLLGALPPCFHRSSYPAHPTMSPKPNPHFPYCSFLLSLPT